MNSNPPEDETLMNVRTENINGGGWRGTGGPPGASKQPIAVEVLLPLSLREDKRKRNTAASARFRLKKRGKDLELKATGTELSDRVKELENEVEGLKLENGWLRNLVLEFVVSHFFLSLFLI